MKGGFMMTTHVIDPSLSDQREGGVYNDVRTTWNSIKSISDQREGGVYNSVIYNNKTNNNHRQINQLLLKYLLFLGRFA
jgi:hypothetical protein